MIWMRFCGWIWHLWTPPAERLKFNVVTAFMNLLGLAALWLWGVPAAARIGDAEWLIVGGWVCSLATGLWVEKKAPAIPFLLASREAAHLKAVAYIPYLVAISLLPCAFFQWASVGFHSSVGELLIVEWGVACSLLVAELLLCGIKNLFA